MSTITMSTVTMTRSPQHDVSAGRVPTYRLTRRGRLTVLLASLVVMLAVGLALATGSVATEERGEPSPTTVVMVGAGETLWDIAAEAADGGDVRDMLLRIQQLNALDSGLVQAGERLRVPIG